MKFKNIYDVRDFLRANRHTLTFEGRAAFLGDLMVTKFDAVESQGCDYVRIRDWATGERMEFNGPPGEYIW